MQERIDQELALLKKYYPNLEYRSEGQWVRIPAYPLPSGWNREATDVAFQIRSGYPGTPPYGFYVQPGIQFGGKKPDNYTEPAPAQPPFEGSWGIFSWQPEDWRPTADLLTGPNLAHWARGFVQRFQAGV